MAGAIRAHARWARRRDRRRGDRLRYTALHGINISFAVLAGQWRFFTGHRCGACDCFWRGNHRLGAGHCDDRIAAVRALRHHQGVRDQGPARADDAGHGPDLRLGGLLHPVRTGGHLAEPVRRPERGPQPDPDGLPVPGHHGRYTGATGSGGHSDALRLLDRRHRPESA